MYTLTVLLVITSTVYGRDLSHFKIPLDGRIVGGTPTTIEKYPYQVSVQFLGSHLCGGSLIKSNYVLTAAHCTEGREPIYLTVRAGSTFHNIGGQVAQVISFCDHPKYVTKIYDYDVSVLKLDKDFELGTGVQPINLQPVGLKVPERTLAVVTGWGAVKWEGPGSKQLQEVTVPKISQNSCQERYPDDNVSERMSCYGYDEGQKDACQGDSGGPLVTGGVQVGIVSWGDECASPRKPGVYTLISNPEIQSHINVCMASL